jgi:hypothetical protein
MFLVECKLVQPQWKLAWRVLKKSKLELPYDLTIPLPDINPKGRSQLNKEIHAHPCLL